MMSYIELTLFTAAQRTPVPCATYTLLLRNVKVYVAQQQITLVRRNRENGESAV